MEADELLAVVTSASRTAEEKDAVLVVCITVDHWSCVRGLVPDNSHRLTRDSYMYVYCMSMQ